MDKIAFISEELCIGCGICAKVSHWPPSVASAVRHPTTAPTVTLSVRPSVASAVRHPTTAPTVTLSVRPSVCRQRCPSPNYSANCHPVTPSMRHPVRPSVASAVRSRPSPSSTCPVTWSMTPRTATAPTVTRSPRPPRPCVTPSVRHPVRASPPSVCHPVRASPRPSVASALRSRPSPSSTCPVTWCVAPLQRQLSPCHPVRLSPRPCVCRQRCPFEAVSIINLPSNLEHDTTHRYSANCHPVTPSVCHPVRASPRPSVCHQRCPFEAVSIINLPSNLERDTTHRYSANCHPVTPSVCLPVRASVASAVRSRPSQSSTCPVTWSMTPRTATAPTVTLSPRPSVTPSVRHPVRPSVISAVRSRPSPSSTCPVTWSVTPRTATAPTRSSCTGCRRRARGRCSASSGRTASASRPR